jgi:pimeloyl-ACP methyl ester carboxylesterase
MSSFSVRPTPCDRMAPPQTPNEKLMTSTLSPTCPLTNSSQAEPACAKRLILRECLERWRRDAQKGVFDTGRYRCRYVVWGRGPTLVLIPGMGMDALGFVMLMDRLQAHFRCISFDLANGETDGAHLMTYRHADHVADLFALLDHLVIRQCTLLGASFGSTIALAALHAQAGRFSHVMLQGGFAQRPLAFAEVLAASFGRFLSGRLAHFPFAQHILAHNQRESLIAREPDVWDFFLEQNLRIPLRALAARALLIHQLDLRPILPTIKLPVLMVCGDRDPLVGKICEAELKHGLPNCARGEIENCGHYPHLTHPEVLAEVVQQFLHAPG